MSITLGDVKATAQALGYSADTTAAQTEMVRSGLRRLYGQRRWKFLQTSANVNTVAGDVTVPVPATSITLEAVNLDDGPLTAVPVEQLRQHEVDVPLRGAPYEWARWGSTIRLYPTPDAVYSLVVEYIARIAPPTADSDVLSWPDEHLDVLTWDLVFRLAARQRDYDTAKWAADQRDQAIHHAASMCGLEHRQNATVMAPWAGWDNVG